MVVPHNFDFSFCGCYPCVRCFHWSCTIYLSIFLNMLNNNVLRDFCLLLLFGLIVIIYTEKWIWGWGLLTFMILGLVLPQIQQYAQLFINMVSNGLQFLILPLIASIIFFLILTPIALVYRLYKKRSLNKSSSFVSVNVTFNDDFFKRQW